MEQTSESSQFIATNDGLRLHVSAYGARLGSALPVVCLPGLTRTTADFATLATALAGDPAQPRYVVAVDYRGRGLSDYDPNPLNYNPAVELSDLLSVITALNLEPAVFIGTSRGGILAMLLATVRPAAIAGVVLNDIGPVMEVQGLARIKSYVGNLPELKSFADGAEALRRLFAPQFPKLSDDDWMAFAKRAFKEEGGRLHPTYDVRIAETLADIDLTKPPPPLWEQFDALAGVPVMVIRGANSDLLSLETLAEMRVHRGDLDVIEVPDQGHAPLLTEPEIITRVSSFVTRCEQAQAGRDPARSG